MKYLLLDSRIIQSIDNARLNLGRVEKASENPLFIEDRPWEVRFDNLYPNVLFDAEDQLFKLWYNPFIVDEAETNTPPERRADTRHYVTEAREMGICYAVSKDGIRWDKPELGLVEFEGSTRNNLVKRSTFGAGVHKDLHDPDPSRRYKMFALMSDAEDQAAVAFSPNGLHWSDYTPCPEIQARGDTHNCFFWDNQSGKYVTFTRNWDGPQRIVARTESEDFLKWTKAVDVMRALPDQPHKQPYTLIAFPYGGLYLGFAMIFDTQLDTVDCELAWSPDTVTWERICPREPLIPRGEQGAFDSGCIYAAAYPILRDDELWLYYGGSDNPHSNWRKGAFCLVHLRVDGFAGMEPAKSSQAATVITKPIEFDGTQLQVTADAAGGSMRVAVLDAEGFTLANCQPITANVTDASVIWRGRETAALNARRLRLRFELRSAKLYSFGFAE